MSKWVVHLLLVLLLTAAVAAQRDVRGVEDLRGRASEARFENGHYRQAGIAFDVPADWTYRGTVPGETPADEAAHWTDPQSGANFSVWLSKRKAATENVTDLLANAVANKTRQRETEGYRRWHVRSESVRHISIGGHQAVVAIADFESGLDGTPRIECLAWIFAPESRVFLFAFVKPDQLRTFQPAFDGIVQSVDLP